MFTTGSLRFCGSVTISLSTPAEVESTSSVGDKVSVAFSMLWSDEGVCEVASVVATSSENPSSTTLEVAASMVVVLADELSSAEPDSTSFAAPMSICTVFSGESKVSGSGMFSMVLDS